jgi:DNA polymerase-3 subunit beta
MLRCGGSRFKLNSVPTDEFPESPSGGKFIAAIPGEILLTMIRSTIFAASRDRDSGRYVLDGARLCIGPDGIQMVATNGHRLSCFERTDVTSDEDFTLLIPRTSLNAITKVFAGSDQEISVGLDANRLFFTQGARRLSCQTVDGQFPDCEPIISQEYKHQLTLDVPTFKEVLKRSVLLARNAHAETARPSATVYPVF